MAAESNNKYDISNWVKKVTDSCENLDQMNAAFKLMRKASTVIDDPELYSELSSYLSIAENRLFDERIEKLSQKVQLLKG